MRQHIKIRKRTVFIFLTLIGLIAYFNSFTVPFHYDDLSFLRENISIKSFPLFFNWVTESYSRIITGRAFLLFTFYLNYLINGLDTFGYHIVNLFIHISTAFLFYLLLAKYVYPPSPQSPPLNGGEIRKESAIEGGEIRKESAIEGGEIRKESAIEGGETKGGTPNIPSPLAGEGKGEGYLGINDKSAAAILAASLFLLHPINTESVTYISSRSSILSTFFMLASMLCFFRGTSQKFNLLFYPLSIIFFILGLSTKESAIVTPILILFFDLYFISDKNENFRARIKYHLPFWGIIAAGFFYYSGYITRPAMSDRPWLTHIFTELKVFIEYLKLLILPFGLNIDHTVKVSTSFALSVIVPFVIILGLLLTAIFLKNRNRILSFSILWFFINLIPFLTIRLEDYMAERWVYTASIGFSLFIGELLLGLFLRHKRIGIFAIACVVISLGVLAHMRNEVYKDPVTLWKDAIQKSPEKIRPYTNLCASYVERQQMDKAIEICKTAIKKGSKQTETYINLATAYFFKKDMNNAESILLSIADSRKIKNDKSLFEIYHYNLGSIYKDKKDYNKAINEYREVLKIRPQSPAALGLIAECYYRLDLKDKAEEYSYLATKGIPQNGEDYLLLAKSFLYLGENQKGIESLNKAIITDPLNGNIRYAVAMIFLEGGNPEAAYKHFSVMAKLSPNLALSYTGMGKATLAKGDLKEARRHFNKALSLLPSDSPERKEVMELLEKTK